MTSARFFRDPDLLNRYTEASPHMEALAMRTLAVGPDGAAMALPYDDRLIGDLESGVLHGGVVTTLIDSVSGLAVLGTMAKPGPLATLDLRIDYLKPATPGRELLARAHCVKITRRIAFTRATAYHLHGDEEDAIAVSQATFIIKTSAPAKTERDA